MPRETNPPLRAKREPLEEIAAGAGAVSGSARGGVPPLCCQDGVTGTVVAGGGGVNVDDGTTGMAGGIAIGSGFAGATGRGSFVSGAGTPEGISSWIGLTTGTTASDL